MNRSNPDAAAASPNAPDETDHEPLKKPADSPEQVKPDSQVGEEDPGAAADQPAVEPIYPPGTHGH